ncbi:MAG: host attachment protein [Proteobacteria bacterium]|nr:host attachment protein [Pseudomonadota bacterium]
MVADGARARFLETRDSQHFEVVDQMASTEARLRSRELGSDHPGRSQESAASARHAVAPRHDPHALAIHRFIQDVAEHLRRADHDHRFERLVLVAPARRLGQLRDCLASETQKKVSREIGRDLIKLPHAELLARLSGFLGPQ